MIYMVIGDVSKAIKILFSAAVLSFMFGCAESRINSVTTDSPYTQADKPMLVLQKEHFGGGYTIEGTKKRTFPAGGEIHNYGAEPAYSAKIRVRIFDASGGAYTDFTIHLGDIGKAKFVAFDETYEVPTDYSGSEIVLTYQDSQKINSVVLKPNGQNINNQDKNSY